MSTDNGLSAFIQQPDKYVLYVDKDEHGKETIKASEKGLWTFIKANTFEKDNYKLSNVVASLATIVSKKKLEDPGMKTFINKLKGKVNKYNTRYEKSSKDSPRQMDIARLNFKISRINQKELSDTLDTAQKLGNLIQIIKYSRHFESEDQLKDFLTDFKECATKDTVNHMNFERNGGTFLHYVARSRDHRALQQQGVVSHLVSVGGDFNKPNQAGMTPFLIAIESGNPAFALAVLGERLRSGKGNRICNLDTKNYDGDTAFHLLFKSRTNDSSMSVGSQIAIAEDLCVQGGVYAGGVRVVNAVNNEGKTPLDILYEASSSPNPEIISMLREVGAKRASELEQQPPGSPSATRY